MLARCGFVHCIPFDSSRRTKLTCFQGCDIILSRSSCVGRVKMSTELERPIGQLSLKKRIDLYPPIEPYKSCMLQVSTIHSIYYEISGNPQGLPVVFVHGGPGGGTCAAHRRFFDPKLYKIVLFDQRGCGKSVPTACLEENNTWALVEDMERVREVCGIEKWVIFGGSWGSTLGVAYAQCHPERVVAMILRGVFMLRDEEIEWLYERNGAGMLYPEAFQRYLNGLPERLRTSSSLMKAYYSILSEDTDSLERRTAAQAWSTWEHSLSCFPKGELEEHANPKYDDGMLLTKKPSNKKPETDEDEDEILAFSRIECHYFMHKGFLKVDGYLLQAEQMRRIHHIPTYIVQGRWDMVCPRKTAYDLYHAFHGNAHLVIVPNAGHSTFESGIESQLLRFCDLVAHRHMRASH